MVPDLLWSIIPGRIDSALPGDCLLGNVEQNYMGHCFLLCARSCDHDLLLRGNLHLSPSCSVGTRKARSQEDPLKKEGEGNHSRCSVFTIYKAHDV